MPASSMAEHPTVNRDVPGSSPGRAARSMGLNNPYKVRYTEPYPVGASYEGVQAEVDCSANPLGITASRFLPMGT